MTKRARGMHDDPLSAASAGLVALGVDRLRRVDVLEVLGCLIDNADFSGTVVLDQAMLEREERLGLDRCLEAYALLERLDVISRTDDGWTITDYRWHTGPVGETEASLAVLRKHLASVGTDASRDELAEVAELAPAAAVAVTAPVVTLKRWRRAVPVAAGLAASAAVVAGITQFVPQAAVTGRNAALSADAPTSVVRRATDATVGRISGATTGPSSTVGTTANSALGATPTTNGLLPGAACALPAVLTKVTSVDLVRLPLGGANGETIWAAVIKGTATLVNADAPLLLPGLNVVAHLADGATDAVQATLAVPLLVPDKAAVFNAVIALGQVKPTTPVTASAAAAGMPTC